MNKFKPTKYNEVDDSRSRLGPVHLGKDAGHGVEDVFDLPDGGRALRIYAHNSCQEPGPTV